MSRSRHTEAQIIGVLKQLEAGRKAEDVAREVGVSKHTIYAWKAKYGGMDVSQAQEAKQLREENTPREGDFCGCLEGNRKGCDIGYALAASSCEGANSVDACTVTALDVITAFAVPNPNCSSQSQSVFSGLVALQVALPSGSLSLLRIGNVLISPTLSAVDGNAN